MMQPERKPFKQPKFIVDATPQGPTLVQSEGATEQGEQDLPAWYYDMQVDLNALLDQRIHVLEKRRETSLNVDAQIAKIEEFRTQQSPEMQLAYVMNNFRLYLPGFPDDAPGSRGQLAFLEEDAEDDPQLKAVIDERKRIFAAIDSALSALHITDEDIAKMRNVITMDKQDPEYKRIMGVLGTLFYQLRAEGFSVKELNT